MKRRLLYPQRDFRGGCSCYAGQKVAGVHNFASATNPGGGVTRGSSAQEECLVSVFRPVLLPERTENDERDSVTLHRNAKN